MKCGSSSLNINDCPLVVLAKQKQELQGSQWPTTEQHHIHGILPQEMMLRYAKYVDAGFIDS